MSLQVKVRLMGKPVDGFQLMEVYNTILYPAVRFKGLYRAVGVVEAHQVAAGSGSSIVETVTSSPHRNHLPCH